MSKKTTEQKPAVKSESGTPAKSKNGKKTEFEKMMKTTTMIRYNFSSKEISEKAQQIGEAVKHLEQVEEELAAIKSDYKEQIIKKNSEIKELSNHITQKYEMRNVECYMRKDFKLKERQYVTHDGEVLKTEPLTPSDYQLRFDEQEKEKTAKKEKKAKKPSAKKLKSKK